MKNYFITKTKNGYRFYILHREGKKKEGGSGRRKKSGWSFCIRISTAKNDV